jgi:hypothetical protein
LGERSVRRRILSVGRVAVVAANGVIVKGHLADEQRYTLDSAHLAEISERQALPLTGLHRGIALHVRQSEGGLAVASVSGAQQ